MTKDDVLNKGKELIATAGAVYLTTVNSKSFPETRAMLNLRNSKQFPGLVDFFKEVDDTEIYFTTNTSSAKVNQITANSSVSVYYCNARSWHGFMCQGNIEIINDNSVKHAIWQDNWTIYYPGGKDSEDYAVLRLKPKYIKSYYKFNQEQIEL